ncbi:MAG: nucleotidyl transferase AbiEii/AbiGii toxin family protein [Lentisphaerae bacterium]|nr:nucleotidyl transferase AbiEii/AbiGii toxin family protein [Lentisphaerota bacterium]
MTYSRFSQALEEALRLLVKRCPRLVRLCYWAGTSCISMEELQHRQSFDLDFHTRKALMDVRPILAEIRKAFPGKLTVVQAPDEFGSGFRGLFKLPGHRTIALEVLSNYEDVAQHDLVPSSRVRGIHRVSLARYLADKIQCVAERSEARDLVDIRAVIRRYPAMKAAAHKWLGEQDGLLMAERLTGWTDKAIREDLEAYKDVRVGDALEARDMLLEWLKERS